MHGLFSQTEAQKYNVAPLRPVNTSRNQPQQSAHGGIEIYTEIFKDILKYIKAHNIPDYDKSLFNNTTLNSTANNMIEYAYKKAIKNHKELLKK